MKRGKVTRTLDQRTQRAQLVIRKNYRVINNVSGVKRAIKVMKIMRAIRAFAGGTARVFKLISVMTRKVNACWWESRNVSPVS